MHSKRYFFSSISLHSIINYLQLYVWKIEHLCTNNEYALHTCIQKTTEINSLFFYISFFFCLFLHFVIWTLTIFRNQIWFPLSFFFLRSTHINIKYFDTFEILNWIENVSMRKKMVLNNFLILAKYRWHFLSSSYFTWFYCYERHSIHMSFQLKCHTI